MKLLRQDEKSFTFLIGKPERELFIALLLRYPVLSAAHFQKRRSAPTAAAGHDDALLREALTDQQKENRKQLEAWLRAEGRFQESDLGCTFTLATAEVEWILQVLNDIRVGSWVELGEPTEKARPPEPLTEKYVQSAWALEIAGVFQHSLLQALDPTEPVE